jgi:hypothetical protein
MSPAWWDYGYQINGLANRTTLADGNTWNHEHIALLGKCLVSPLPEVRLSSNCEVVVTTTASDGPRP